MSCFTPRQTAAGERNSDGQAGERPETFCKHMPELLSDIDRCRNQDENQDVAVGVDRISVLELTLELSGLIVVHRAGSEIVRHKPVRMQYPQPFNGFARSLELPGLL